MFDSLECILKSIHQKFDLILDKMTNIEKDIDILKK